MTYDKDFFKKYEKYLQEPTVREVHDKMFNFAANYPSLKRRVLDLGCGNQEYYNYTRPEYYVGVDNLNAQELLDVKKIDYRNVSEIINLINMYNFTGVVSLFSTEITGSYSANNLLYNNLFTQTNLDSMMVSGFYYDDTRRNHEIIEEIGGIFSFQSNFSYVRSDLYTETRITAPCPSKLFGDSVIEVWRFLTKK